MTADRPRLALLARLTVIACAFTVGCGSDSEPSEIADDRSQNGAVVCEEQLVEDEYGFQELVEVCDSTTAVSATSGREAPTPRPTSAGDVPLPTPSVVPVPTPSRATPPAATVPPESEAADLSPALSAKPVPSVTAPVLELPAIRPDERSYRHEPRASLDGYLGSADAARLSRYLQQHFLDLPGCSAPIDRTDAEPHLALIPDPGIAQQIRYSLSLLALADAKCQVNEGPWARLFADALQALDVAAVAIDTGNAPPLDRPRQGLVLDDPPLLADYATAVFDRTAWALKQGFTANSGLWRGTNQFSVVQGLAAMQPASRAQIDVVVLGNSQTTEGIDAATTSSESGRRVANLGVRGVLPSWSAAMLRQLVDDPALEGFAPAEVLLFVSTWQFATSCPTVQAPPIASGTLAAAPLLADIPLVERLGREGVDGPVQRASTATLGNWPQVMGQTDFPSRSSYEPDDAEIALYYTAPVSSPCGAWVPFLSELATDVEAWGGSLTVVLNPQPTWVRELLSRTVPELDNELQMVFNQLGASKTRVIDLTGLLSDDQYRDHKGHPTASGRQALSSELAASLIE